MTSEAETMVERIGAKTVNEAERIAGEDCPTTFGRESVSHCFVTVTRSSYRPTPYRMCSKCGRILSETPHAE